MALNKDISQGRHLLIDFFGVDPARLRNRASLMRTLRTALKKAGFWIIKEAGSHKFEGGGEGVTGFFLLGQSHAAFHSYPEHGYMALDIYSCGSCDAAPVAASVERYLKPRKTSRVSYMRG